MQLIMECKYKEDEVVYERIRPNQKLIVKGNVGKIYYCKVQEDPNRKELVYFERELMSDPNIADKK